MINLTNVEANLSFIPFIFSSFKWSLSLLFYLFDGSGNQEGPCRSWTMLYPVIYEFFFSRGSYQTFGTC